jgi:hypothetical protein
VAGPDSAHICPDFHQQLAKSPGTDGFLTDITTG